MTATALPQARKYTIDDFNALPEGPPYYEFDEGDIIELGSPTLSHQDIIDEIVRLTKAYARKNRSGRVFREVDVYLPDGRVYVPDFGFLANDKTSLVNTIDEKVHGAPTMVAEVTSSNEARDRTRKFHVYFENGVEWLWLISQMLIIEEYRATQPGYVRVSTTAPGETFKPQLFPGLEINLAALLNDDEMPAEPQQPGPSQQPG